MERDPGIGTRVDQAPRPVDARTALAIGPLAFGAGAVGAFAIGALAIGRLGIGNLAVRRGRMDNLAIGDLTVDRLRVREQIVGWESQPESSLRGG